MSEFEPDGTVFDAATISAAAAACDVDQATVRDVLVRFHETVAAAPGVENLVYEWRRRFDGSLAGQSDDAYYLVVPEHVWDEYAEHLDLDDRTRAALVDVHRRTVVARTDRPTDPPADRTYVALDRRATRTGE